MRSFLNFFCWFSNYTTKACESARQLQHPRARPSDIPRGVARVAHQSAGWFQSRSNSARGGIAYVGPCAREQRWQAIREDIGNFQHCR
eukprot:3831070-Pyramimonas_sp.AAC.1